MSVFHCIRYWKYLPHFWFAFYFIWNVGVVEIVMNTFLSDHDTQAIRITVGAVTLLVVAIVAMIGAESYGKFNRFLFPGELEGFFFTLFAIGISAAETAVAIAIIINIYRNLRNIQVRNLREMKW